MEQRWHGVEEVRGHGGSGVDCRSGCVAVRSRVTDGSDGTAIDDHADSVERAGQFGRERDHADPALARVEDARHLIGIGVAQGERVVRTAVRRRDPRALEVDATQGAVIDEGDERAHLRDQVVVRRGDQARMHRGRAVVEMGLRSPSNLLRVGGGEGRTAAAMAVQVDVAGHERVGAHGLAGGRPGADLDDGVALDADPGVWPLAVGIDDALRGEHERHAPTLGHRGAG